MNRKFWLYGLMMSLTTSITACGGDDDETPTPTETDADDDGFSKEDGDCNDSDKTINPGAKEVCDGVDQDCDEQKDDGVLKTFYKDVDGDNFGNVAEKLQACSAPTGYVSDSTDCDDSVGSSHPTAVETCDGVDNNCDTFVDEGVKTTFYHDSDHDTFGSASMSQEACSAPADYVDNKTDCNDGDKTVNPNATEVCDSVDNNCNSSDDITTLVWYVDADTDGFGDKDSASVVSCDTQAGYSLTSTDCDDSNSAVNPSAIESDTCDGTDSNCDGDTDSDVFVTVYPDADTDGFGDKDSAEDKACTDLDGFVSDDTDCDDTDGEVNPSVVEVCDEADNNCDTFVDEGVTTTFYQDGDSDSFGTSDTTVETKEACSAPTGYVSDSTDCDDSTAAVNPKAEEVCNDSIDNDCDSLMDSDDKKSWYLDTDGDGYGDTSTVVEDCSQPADVDSHKYVLLGNDCDESDTSINPSQTEVCDSIDNDCSGTADDGLEFVSYYQDNDDDSFGDVSTEVSTCSGAPDESYTTDSTDCDDSDASINPSAEDVCDGKDNNCDTVTDEPRNWYLDSDLDGFGDASTETSSCVKPDGDYVLESNDCNDSDASINPSAEEVCDEVDNNCNSETDEGLKATFYLDSDSDDFGDVNNSLFACTMPEGYTTDSTDCNDSEADINPNAEEVCDEVDNNCNNETDEDLKATFYLDSDADDFGDVNNSLFACTVPEGYTTDSTDCNDSNSDINPSMTEICDELDNDCNGSIDDDLDADGDGYIAEENEFCKTEEQMLGDCDDTSATTHPGAEDASDDGIDQDCGGTENQDASLGFGENSSADLQEALDNAVDGSTIWVGEGTYPTVDVHFTLDKSVVIRATGSSENTIFDGYTGSSKTSEDVMGTMLTVSSNLETFDIEDNTLTIDGVTFKNGYSGVYAGAIALDNVYVTIKNSQFESNTAVTKAGAIYGYLSTIMIDNTVFSNNTTTGSDIGGNGFGGAISADDSTLYVSNSLFENNTSLADGAAINLYNVSDSKSITNSHSSFVSNGIVAGSLTVINSEFVGNSVSLGNGGAVAVTEASAVTISDSFFDSNSINLEKATATSSMSGGAVYIANSKGNVDVSSSVFSNNSDMNAYAGNGGALFVGYSKEGVVVNVDLCEFSDNTIIQGYGGGAAFTNNEVANLSSLRFNNNSSYFLKTGDKSSGGNAGGLSLYHSADFSKTAIATVENSYFLENKSDNGGAGLYSNSNASGDNFKVVVNNSRFINNVVTSASYYAFGGGAYINYTKNAEFNNVLFEGNIAETASTKHYPRGGAVNISGKDTYSTTFNNCNFVSNIARNLATVDAKYNADGGGVATYTVGLVANIYNSIFSNNTKNLFGGASVYSNIFNDSSKSATLDVKYNDIYPSSSVSSNIVLDSTNLSSEPQFLSSTDYHLALTSSLVNMGREGSSDIDDSRLDIGMYGGSFAGSFDMDLDGLNDYFWPGSFSDAPSGVDSSLFDSNDWE